MKAYGLTAEEARRVEARPEVLQALDAWRVQNGLPATASPLTRGKLLELLGSLRGL